MAKIRYKSEGIYVGRDLYTWDDVLKEFRKLVLVDPKAKVTNLNDLQVALERAVFDTDMKRNRWGIWSALKAGLEHLTTAYIPAFVILGGEETDSDTHPQFLEFVEVENVDGFSISTGPLTRYPNSRNLWRLGPFLAFVREPSSQAVPGPLATGSESVRKDGASRGRDLVPHGSRPVEPPPPLVGDSTNPTPYKGPIAIPCSSCSAGDTTMKYHTHDWVPLEDRRPAYPEKTTFHGGQDR